MYYNYDIKLLLLSFEKQKAILSRFFTYLANNLYYRCMSFTIELIIYKSSNNIEIETLIYHL